MSDSTPTERGAGAALALSIEQDRHKRGKGKNLSPLKQLWPFVARYKAKLALFLLFLGLSAIATLILPNLLKVIIDCGFGGGNSAKLSTGFCSKFSSGDSASLAPYFKLALVFVVCYASFSALRYYFVTSLGQRVIADIREAVYANVIRQSQSYFAHLRTGEVLSRLTTDTTLIETVLTGSASFAIRTIVTSIGAIALMFVFSWQLALMVLAIGPLVVIPAVWIGRKLKTLSAQGQDDLARASGGAAEALGQVQIVQAFTRESYESERFNTAVESSYASQERRIKARTALTFLIFIIALGGITVILWYGAISVSQGRLTGGDIGAFTVCAIIAVSGGSALTESWSNFMRAAGASERLVALLEAEPDIRSKEDAIALPNARGEIAFNNVSFNYPQRPEVKSLSNISFSVNPGETVALVGPSGAGKSTVFQLLMRFYDLETGKGNITLDAHKIDDIILSDLRDKFALVSQNTALFSGTARDNIAYGKTDATDDEILRAAKLAHANEFITRLPQGYDTDLGDRSLTLSGGQRQRIAIARAILSDAPILLLDEATSALDSESERLVQDALDTLASNRTTLVIAHRLATIRKADRILVMDQGKIVATGTDKELKAQGGLYADLAKLQFNE